MKNILVAAITAATFSSAPVLAADMPTKAPVYRATSAASSNWTGCYIGANTGGTWAHKSTTLTNDLGLPTDVFLGSLTASGWAYGGQIGCDYQFANNWVVGIRGMWDGSSLKGSNQVPSGVFTNNVKIDSFGTVVGKLGYLVNPSIEIYGLAGVAWVRDHYFFTQTGFGEFASGNQTRTGYDLGVGVSWMFAPNWNLWLEYDHMGFGTRNAILADTSGLTRAIDVQQSVDKVLVGINYRFVMGKNSVNTKY